MAEAIVRSSLRAFAFTASWSDSGISTRTLTTFSALCSVVGATAEQYRTGHGTGGYPFPGHPS